ncbi:hypothetical protein H5410_000681 [Solanum commersonii]|uniref:Uncharacterized protein n=1 Tax=Solanum commersonii TaxID=4109 RepID=A0A9J6AWX3_SOLCO|nr:hypothetical protein H5410_000681 [Solanum commersonii]
MSSVRYRSRLLLPEFYQSELDLKLCTRILGTPFSRHPDLKTRSIEITYTGTKFFPSFKLPCDFPSFDGVAFVWRSMGNAESLYNSTAGPALNGWPAAIILPEIGARV